MRADELQYQATGRIRIPPVRNSRASLFLTLYKSLKPVSDDIYSGTYQPGNRSYRSNERADESTGNMKIKIWKNMEQNKIY